MIRRFGQKRPRESNRRSAMTVRVSWLCVALLSSMCLPAAFAHDPPKNLKKIGDHWTAWDPPMVLPEGTDIHIIERGDTLWDLAERFLGNPYLWPQIWERNSYILDAHWIYPGDPLVLGIEVEPQEALEMTAVERAGASDEPETGFRYGDAFGRIEQLGSGDDIYCSGYLGDPDESFAFHIKNSEYDFLSPRLEYAGRQTRGRYGIVDSIQYNLAVGDVVYLDAGRSGGLAPGDVLMVVAPGKIIRHPVTDTVVGRLQNYQGRVRVLSVQEETSIAEVSYSCEQMVVGAALIPFVQEPVPTERRSPMRPVNLPSTKDRLATAPRVLYAKDGIISIGQDHVVYIELPAQGVAVPGDLFTVYRVSESADLPVVIGEVAVLSVHPRAAVAKVLESRYPIYVGDVLEPK